MKHKIIFSLVLATLLTGCASGGGDALVNFSTDKLLAFDPKI